MKPVLFAAEMAEVDAAALNDVTIDVLGRACRVGGRQTGLRDAGRHLWIGAS